MFVLLSGLSWLWERSSVKDSDEALRVPSPSKYLSAWKMNVADEGGSAMPRRWSGLLQRLETTPAPSPGRTKKETARAQRDC
ncbi:hypothetical protein F1880_004334 [Penicillium rolfsii]|nr:hypothetical protein F1880_004334 [Penicillium rolfsii]